LKNGQHLAISKHSVIEAKNQLSALIERALKGERVVITRHGQPVAEIRTNLAQQNLQAPSSHFDLPAANEQVRAGEFKIMNDAQFEWLEYVAIKPLKTGQSAVDLVRQMRDEDWH
jgi:prevent-host-death family protein